MNNRIRILHLEDDPDFHALLASLLEQAGIDAQISLVSTRQEYESMLGRVDFDVILADYLLPAYNGIEALRVARERCPETPFLLVSGTIGEQAALESLKSGATDYVLKLCPDRLAPAVRRAAQESAERRQRRRIETELIRREKYFRALTENSLDVVTVLNREGAFLYNSPSLKRVLGYEPRELSGRLSSEFVHPEDLGALQAAFDQGLVEPGKTMTLQFRMRHQEGTWRHLEAVGQNRLFDPEIAAVVVNSRDITDRTLAEENLRQSEKHYRMIFDGNPTPMWVWDQETLKFLQVNDAALRHYGYSREEFLSMTVKEIRPPEDVPSLEEYLSTCNAGGANALVGLAGVWRHLKRDGTIIHVDIKWSPISYRGRAAALTMANDVTDRRRTEQRDAALSKLGKHLGGATTPLEAARSIRSVTDELFGGEVFSLDLYSSEAGMMYPTLNVDTDREGRQFEVILTGEGKPPSGRAKRIITQGAELILREEPLTLPLDATPFGDVTRPSASLMLAPVRNRTKVIGILSIQSYKFRAFNQRDLDALQMLADHCGGALERIHAEQVSHENQMLFRSVWDNSGDGMRLTDEAGEVVAVNSAYCRLVGLKQEQLVGKPFTEMFAKFENADAVLADYRVSFAARKTGRTVERKLTLRGDRQVILEESNSFVELLGQAPRMLTLFRDITAQKQLEEQLRQSQKMEAIGQLAGGVAHDFNNILTVIHGHASLLQAGGTLTGLASRSANQISHAADRAATLTRQLLTFSRRQVMQPRRLDLNEVVGHMAKMLARILGEDIMLQLTYSPHPALVEADSGMLEQVLLNLAVNSRDAMPKGGQLVIELALVDVDARRVVEYPEAQVGRFVCLSASDTGSGIPPEILRRVFEPFFTTKEVGKGTGLGLATVYGIVQQHQGWIEVESALGKGTTFRVFLPETKGSVQTAEDPSAPRPVRGGSETILVVEDEAPVRELVCNLLSSQGYTVLQAESGVHALEVWKSHRLRVDLLLTDLVMPDRLNGRELAEKLLGERPDLKVIYTSGYSADVVGKDFVLRGGLNYLQKPYAPQKLALTVRDCLDATN